MVTYLVRKRNSLFSTYKMSVESRTFKQRYPGGREGAKSKMKIILNGGHLF